MAAVVPVTKGRSIYIAAADSGAAWADIKRVTAIYAYATAASCTVLLHEGGDGGNVIYHVVATALPTTPTYTTYPLTPLVFATPQDIKDLYVKTLSGAFVVIFTA